MVVCKVKQTSEGDLTHKNVANVACKVKHESESMGSTEATRFKT